MTQVQDDNNLDSYYEDSILSITEDVQYPLFDADAAKAGIITEEKTSPTKLPHLKKVKSEKSKFQNVSKVQEQEDGLDFKDVFTSEIKIDEPAIFAKGDTQSSPTILNKSTFCNKKSSLGLGEIVPSQGPRKIGVHRPLFRPGQLRVTTSNNPDQSKDELSPRSEMMPELAEKMSNINKNRLNANLADLIRTTSSSDDNKPEKSKNVDKINNTVNRNLKAKESHDSQPAASRKKSPVIGDEQSDVRSKQGLAGRKDVVYKTLLRSIKRYYSTEFENKTEYSRLTKSKQEKR